MNPLQTKTLEGFSPELYLATLSEVAHSDGLHPDEKDLLQQQAVSFGVDLDDLPEVPADLSNLPWVTKILVYRDALLLAFEDDHVSAEEQEYLDSLRKRLDVSSDTAESISAWVREYDSLLSRMDAILSMSS